MEQLQPSVPSPSSVARTSDASRSMEHNRHGFRGADIKRAINAAARGEMVFGPEVSQRVASLFQVARPPAGKDSFPELGERELTLLDLLAAGEDNAAIGRHLGLAPKTVRNQISLLLTKLGVADRVAAVLLARQAGLGRTAFGP